MVAPATKIGRKNLVSLNITIKASGIYPTIEELRTIKLNVIARVSMQRFLSNIFGLIFK